MINFAGSNSTSDSSSRFIAMGIDSGLPIVVAGGAGGLFEGRDFLKIFSSWGGVIIPGRPLIEGRLV